MNFAVIIIHRHDLAASSVQFTIEADDEEAATAGAARIILGDDTLSDAEAIHRLNLADDIAIALQPVATLQAIIDPPGKA